MWLFVTDKTTMNIQQMIKGESLSINAQNQSHWADSDLCNSKKEEGSDFPAALPPPVFVKTCHERPKQY